MQRQCILTWITRYCFLVVCMEKVLGHFISWDLKTASWRLDLWGWYLEYPLQNSLRIFSMEDPFGFSKTHLPKNYHFFIIIILLLTALVVIYIWLHSVHRRQPNHIATVGDSLLHWFMSMSCINHVCLWKTCNSTILCEFPHGLQTNLILSHYLLVCEIKDLEFLNAGKSNISTTTPQLI